MRDILFKMSNTKLTEPQYPFGLKESVEIISTVTGWQSSINPLITFTYQETYTEKNFFEILMQFEKLSKLVTATSSNQVKIEVTMESFAAFKYIVFKIELYRILDYEKLIEQLTGKTLEYLENQKRANDLKLEMLVKESEKRRLSVEQEALAFQKLKERIEHFPDYEFGKNEIGVTAFVAGAGGYPYYKYMKLGDKVGEKYFILYYYTPDFISKNDFLEIWFHESAKPVRIDSAVGMFKRLVE